MQTLSELAQAIVTALHEHGGATLDRHGKPVTRGLSVAVSPKFERQLVAPWSIGMIEHWLKTIWPQLLVNNYYCIGAWQDSDGTIYLDVVDVLPAAKFDYVIRNALERKQKAIYFLDTGTLLRIE